jgi:type II secretion system protein I
MAVGVVSRRGLGKTLNSRDGLSLLETIVALAILTIGIASVLHVFSTSIAATKEAESYSTAAMLANQVALGLESQTSVDTGQDSGAFDDETAFSWSTDVEDADDNGLMRTTVTITWNAGNNPRSYDMVVYLKQSTSTTSSTSTSGGAG